VRGWFTLLLAAIAGCGRFGFEPVEDDVQGDDTSGVDAAAGDSGGDTDAPSTLCPNMVGHDEDGDGFDDGCDACPQITDDQKDTDLDGVGDACDLATSFEQRMYFDPAITKRPGWRYDTNQTLNGDSITLPGTSGASVIMFTGMPGHTVVEVGGRIAAVGGSDHQLALHIGREGNTNYYCELYESGGSRNVKLTLNNSGTYSNINATPVPGTYTVGSTVRLAFEHTPPNMRCVVWWNGVRYQAQTAAAPGVVPLEQIYLAANGIDAEIQYFVQLAMP